MQKQPPNIKNYDGIQYVFTRKIKENMYMYKSTKHGFPITFDAMDLGLVERDNSRKMAGNTKKYTY